MERFDRNDAIYTEVIHTNIGCMGYTPPLAVVDFYPNFGEHQPGCEEECSFDGFNFNADLTHGCSHNRALTIFVESINSDQFYGIKCADGFDDIQQQECQSSPDFAVMGDHPNKLYNAVGVFYLKTNSKFPYARGKTISCSCAYVD